MYITLNERTQKSIEKSTGIKVRDMVAMDAEKIDLAIEKRMGKKLQFLSSKGGKLSVRGSVYIFLNRLISVFIIDKKLSQI